MSYRLPLVKEMSNVTNISTAVMLNDFSRTMFLESMRIKVSFWTTLQALNFR